jgi:hypothetical protein
MTADTSVAKHEAQLAERAGEVALCLPFEGNLSPIVYDPEAARPLQGIVEILEPPSPPVRRCRPHLGPPGRVPGGACRGVWRPLSRTV